MKRETKATLEIITREILDIVQSDREESKRLKEVESLLETWIQANDLHPEKVCKKGNMYFREEEEI